MTENTYRKLNRKGILKGAAICALFLSSTTFAISTVSQTSSSALSVNDIDPSQSFIYKLSTNNQ